MYEQRGAKPVTRQVFLRRLAAHLGVACLIVAVSLAIGMAGYMIFERLSWVDAFLNASMLLGGMGPVETPATAGGKIFAGLYALYAGMILLVVVAIILGPIVHRLLHLFHWKDDDAPQKRKTK